MVDTLRPDRLTTYGNPRPTSPNIDLLARHGAVFDRAFSHAPWTPPSMASLFTSTHESVHGLSMSPGNDERFSVLDGNFETMAEYLRERGLRTMAVSAQPWISEQTGFDQGFDDFRIVGSTSQMYETEKVGLAAIEQIRDHASERFFLYLHFMTPHTPYNPPYPFSEMEWNRSPPKKFLPHLDKPNREVWEFLVHDLPDEGVEQEDIDYLLSLYDSEVLYVDTWIGVIHRELVRQGLIGQTLVVLVADHGEAFYEHDRAVHGDQLYNEVLHIPLIFSHPEWFPEGSRIDHLARIVDVFPTVVDLLHGDPLPQFQGKSLFGTEPRPWAYAERRVHRSNDREEELEKIQTPQWSLIWRRDRESYELYALDDDPGEQLDLFAVRPKAAERLIVLLNEARAANLSHPDRTQPAETRLDPDTFEQLRSLGYVE